MPPTGGSTEQTGALVGDFDGDGINGFILSFRQKAPALVWYRRVESGWKTYVIEKDYLPLEAGGAAYDIDGDGDLDIVFGGDWQSDEIWWWENPAPNFDPAVPWKRHVIKKGGETQHHDQIFGDFKNTGTPQLVFWNQGSKTIFIADIPAHPRETEPWPFVPLYSGRVVDTSGGGNAAKYPEGLAAADIDGDGVVDLLAGNYWFKYLGAGKFKPIRIGSIGGRIRAAKLIEGSKYPQVVIAPGDGSGPLRWYECKGDPQNEKDWVGHDLGGRDMIHGHTLELGDINGDGHLDIFAAEMAKWTEARSDPDNPKAETWIFYGDGKGNFRKTVLVTGNEFHEGRLADLDGDGDLDILNKPYNWETPRVDVWLNNGTGPRKHAGVGKSFTGPLGLELYSLRHHFVKNVPLTLDYVHDFGFTEVEGDTYGYQPTVFVNMLAARGMKLVGTFVDYEKFQNDLDDVIKDAKALGVQYVLCGWIPHEGTGFTDRDVHNAAKLFNRVGEKLNAAGLKFIYHPHGYEFRPYKNGTLFDLLAAETRPEFVSFELDVFWIEHSGADPVKLMRKYGTRFSLMHVKDLRKGAARDFTGAAPDTDSVAIGSGSVDWPGVLKEARRIGVKHYFIEDESSEAIDQIPQSLRYLESLRW
ncbi:MAG TPA: TIM barrel protein [Terriglobales bacterium]|nr:TIM barrel protein [Terriglobales bacterium]